MRLNKRTKSGVLVGVKNGMNGRFGHSCCASFGQNFSVIEGRCTRSGKSCRDIEKKTPPAKNLILSSIAGGLFVSGGYNLIFCVLPTFSRVPVSFFRGLVSSFHALAS
jgi:hypothetical protein